MPQQSIADLKIPTPLDDPAMLRLLNRQPSEGDRVSMTGRLQSSGHAIAIESEYREGAYRVVRVTVTADDGGEITSADLGIPVKEASDGMLSKAWALFGKTADIADRAEDFRRQQRRRWLTDDFLREVAEAHQAAERSAVPSVIASVAARFSASQSSAERWVREARKRGLLPPSRRGRG